MDSTRERVKRSNPTSWEGSCRKFQKNIVGGVRYSAKIYAQDKVNYLHVKCCSAEIARKRIVMTSSLGGGGVRRGLGRVARKEVLYRKDWRPLYNSLTMLQVSLQKNPMGVPR